MTTTPGADEHRIRHLLRTRGVGPDAPPMIPERTRPRDWLDDLWDDGEPRPAVVAPPPPPRPPDPPKTAPVDTPGEPRWDWRRLRHWPNLGLKTRLCCALAAVAAPILPGGYSTATTWWYCVHQARHHYGMGYGYTLGGGALALAISAVTRRGRHAGLIRVTFLAVAAIGFLGAMSWTDIITLVTGAL